MAKLLRTKTFWVGVGSIIAAIGGAMTGEMSWGDAMPMVVMGALGITGRHAVTKGR